MQVFTFILIKGISKTLTVFLFDHTVHFSTLRSIVEHFTICHSLKYFNWHTKTLSTVGIKDYSRCKGGYRKIGPRRFTQIHSTSIKASSLKKETSDGRSSYSSKQVYFGVRFALSPVEFVLICSTMWHDLRSDFRLIFCEYLSFPGIVKYIVLV